MWLLATPFGAVELLLGADEGQVALWMLSRALLALYVCLKSTDCILPQAYCCVCLAVVLGDRNSIVPLPKVRG